MTKTVASKLSLLFYTIFTIKWFYSASQACPVVLSSLKIHFLDYIANIIVSITNASNLIGSQQLLFTA